MNNTNEKTKNIASLGAKLDEKSKKLFWESIPEEIQRRTNNANFDITSRLKWSGEKFFLSFSDYLSWLKSVYPKSVIQTEKAMFTETYCQYKVRIFTDVNDNNPTEVEGPVIWRDEEDLYQNHENYIGTARTKAVAMAIRYLGFGPDLDVDLKVVNTATPSPIKNQNLTLNEALNTKIAYAANASNRKYDGNTIQNILDMGDAMFLKGCLRNQSVTVATKNAINVVLQN